MIMIRSERAAFWGGTGVMSMIRRGEKGREDLRCEKLKRWIPILLRRFFFFFFLRVFLLVGDDNASASFLLLKQRTNRCFRVVPGQVLLADERDMNSSEDGRCITTAHSFFR